MDDLLAVQVVQTNEDHCEVIHSFIFRKNLLLLDQGIEIAAICKLSDYAQLFYTWCSLVFKIIMVLDNERMVSSLQYLEFSINTQFLLREKK